MSVKELISCHKPCRDGLAFARLYDDPQEAWDACPRPDWLIWVLERVEPTLEYQRKVLICTNHVARLMLPAIEEKFPDWKTPRQLLDACEHFLSDSTGALPLSSVQELYLLHDREMDNPPYHKFPDTIRYMTSAVHYATRGVVDKSLDMNWCSLSADYVKDANELHPEQRYNARGVEIIRGMFPNPPTKLWPACQ